MGRVRSLHWRGGYIVHEIFQKRTKNGYMEIVLTVHKKEFHKSTHRLVAEAFIPNPEHKRFVDHINCERSDNRASNLRWCTAKENANNPITRARQSNAQILQMKRKWESGKCEAVKKPVKQYSLEGVFIHDWPSAAEAARKLFFDSTNINKKSSLITRCCRGERRKSLGYIWVFSGDEEKVPLLIARNKFTKSIRVKMSYPDGRTILYDSINSAAKDSGIQNRTIRTRRLHRGKNILWELLDEGSCYTSEYKKLLNDEVDS